MSGTSSSGGPAREPTVAELRAFVAVAEELHFRRAATRLGIAPPPLSQTIRRLEEKVGSVLLDRTPRTVTLTPAGVELLPRARDILQRMAEAQVAVRGAADQVGAPLRIGIASNGFAELTGPILEAFRGAHARVRLELFDITNDPMPALLSGAVDLALVRPPISDAPDPRLLVEPVVLEPRAALLPNAHRLAEADVVSIMDLADDVCVATAPALPEICAYWAAAKERGGEPVRYGPEAWTVQEVLQGVGYMGAVVTSIPSVLRFFHVPGIVAVPLSDVGPAPMAFAARAGDRRRVVTEFRRTVQLVSERLVDLVPGAFLAPA
jgi:DNA-binding transcriptional LysR family regulator